MQRSNGNNLSSNPFLSLGFRVFTALHSQIIFTLVSTCNFFVPIFTIQIIDLFIAATLFQKFLQYEAETLHVTK